ncbi:hypothetical protein PHLGIDRAFT_305189 [Phlebiopsis gigantea 11061_1 CR5-6]|uniref:Uncharacterized protein n=1 Tax=Phlebiopsis gigantea (strain 11061_1 CR5-6) TaxID=745531 RepID=A0A0C3RQR3_PHLG1|nr:hypothetical protein PHLGIDRAFT_305189 [Phlebiopsis gigantea 11061_1 CR5-6]
MPSELRSTTSLQVVSSPCEEAKLNSLRLATSTPTPSSSFTSPRKRKFSTAQESDSVAVNPKPLKMPQPSKRPCSRVPPPPLEMPTTSSSGATDAEPTEDTSPPSPVPTEIIDVEAEDFVRTAQRYGVKVRDYAVDPPAPPLPRVAELWMNPVHTLLVHDMHIRRPAERDLCLPGKQLRRLLDVGYVTQKEADAYWTEEDKLLLKEYDERPDGHYPYVIAFKRPKPTAAFRVSAREIVYGMSRPGDIPDARIEVPDDGTWEGDEESWAFAARMKQGMERFVAPGMRVGSESLPPLGLIESQSRPSIFPLPVKTPPVHAVSLPHTPASKQQGECEPAAKSNEPSTPTTPPVATTPTTPTSPPPTAPQPSNSRRLGRTATLAAIPVR